MSFVAPVVADERVAGDSNRQAVGALHKSSRREEPSCFSSRSKSDFAVFSIARAPKIRFAARGSAFVTGVAASRN
jgi:hypothetical protein